VDGRFVGYVLGAWGELVAYARVPCPDASVAEAEQLVLAALTRVAGRWRLVRDKDHPDTYVRQVLIRTCVSRDKRVSKEPSDILLMDVGFVDRRPTPVVEASAGVRAEINAEEALARLAHRVSRVNRRRLVVAVGTVVVVVAVALTVPGSKAPPRQVVAKHKVTHLVPRLLAFPESQTNFAGGVTSGGGFIWTIETHATLRGSVAEVVQRDPVNGEVAARFPVPQADDHIGYGFGKAWTWHDGADFPNTAIATMSDAGGIETLRTTPPVAIHDVTFTGNGAWLTEPKVNRVMKFADGVLGADSDTTLPGARFVVPLSATSVLVSGRTGVLHELPSGIPVLAGRTAPTLLDPAPSFGFWLGFGRRVTYLAALGGPENIKLTMPLAVAQVVGDPSSGVYIALKSDDPLNHDPYLVYYSPLALEASHPKPTAHLDGLTQAEGLAVDPAGGVVFVTNSGTVEAWRPDGLRRASQGATALSSLR
jgi:hypothetical protein